MITRLLIHAFLASAAAAQVVDWNADPARGAVDLAKAASRLAAAQAAAAPSASGRIDGVTVNGSIQLGHRNVRAWLEIAPAEGGKSRRLVAKGQSCADDMEPSDCRFSIYEFPALRLDEARGVVLSGTIIVARFDAGGKVVLDGYALQKDIGRSWLSLALVPGKAAPVPAFPGGKEAYFGYVRTTRGLYSICFEVSPRSVDRYAGDPDISQGVFVSREIRYMIEEGPMMPRNCRSSWEMNGDYLRDCDGLFLTGVRTATPGEILEGDVFERLERFDPATGALTLLPSGRYSLERVPGC